MYSVLQYTCGASTTWVGVALLYICYDRDVEVDVLATHGLLWQHHPRWQTNAAQLIVESEPLSFSATVRVVVSSVIFVNVSSLIAH